MSVVQFPLYRLADNIKRHLNAFFRDMADKGYTQEQMNDMMIKSLKDIGAVEIDGVWQIPGTLSSSASVTREST